MRIIRFQTHDTIHWGAVEGNDVFLLEGSPFSEHRVSGRSFALADVRVLAPCQPSKIVCVGRNYAEHAKELNNEPPTSPLIFLKPPSAVIGHRDQIVYPPESQRVDYEGEIAIVIGRRLRRLAGDAPGAPYILGFTCLNDITARDLQKADGQWTRGKGFDTFCAIGPAVATDLDPASLSVRTHLNGELKQQGHVREMIFDFDTLLRYISGVMTLEPGDVIATGTPAGVGPMQPGDEVTVEVEGVGRLRNTVVRFE
jgi:2-keto-4-pentenoate hydratase/2-oxohepta-3-ene-1,7-dioic acid hydratase in catechol pathway